MKTKDNVRNLFTFQNIYIKAYSVIPNIFYLKTKRIWMCKNHEQNLKKVIGSGWSNVARKSLL